MYKARRESVRIREAQERAYQVFAWSTFAGVIIGSVAALIIGGILL